MDIIINIIVGGIVGWLASIVMKTNAQMGKIANVVVGIIGTNVGFWLSGKLGLAAGGDIVRYLIAIGGAVVLIALLKLFGVYK